MNISASLSILKMFKVWNSWSKKNTLLEIGLNQISNTNILCPLRLNSIIYFEPSTNTPEEWVPPK